MFVGTRIRRKDMDIASQSANKALLSYLSHQSLRSHKTKQKEEKVV